MERAVTAVRMPYELYEEVRKRARAADQSMNAYIVLAVKRYNELVERNLTPEAMMQRAEEATRRVEKAAQALREQRTEIIYLLKQEAGEVRESPADQALLRILEKEEAEDDRGT